MCACTEIVRSKSGLISIACEEKNVNKFTISSNWQQDDDHAHTSIFNFKFNVAVGAAATDRWFVYVIMCNKARTHIIDCEKFENTKSRGKNEKKCVCLAVLFHKTISTAVCIAFSSSDCFSFVLLVFCGYEH